MAVFRLPEESPRTRERLPSLPSMSRARRSEDHHVEMRLDSGC